MIKIFINGRFLTQRITGVQRYAHEVLKAIDTLLVQGEIKEISFEILTPKTEITSGSYQSIPIRKVGYLKGHFWEQIELPFYTKNNLLINLCNTAPIVKLKQLVVIHDAAVYANPSNFSFLFRTWYRILLKVLVTFSFQVITVSHNSKSEIIKYCGEAKRDIKVIYEGAEHVKRYMNKDLTINKQSDKPYVLAVSSINPNKNFKSIIQAIRYLHYNGFTAEIELVIAGATNNKIFHQALEELPNWVKCIGYVTDAELISLYENANCFIFPSFYEGFGLPPLEAMACGCPVIVSNTSSLPEVCGDAVLYCNPYEYQDIAEKILLLIHNKELREIFKQKGMIRAQQFTWQQCAKEIIDVLKTLPPTRYR